MTNADIDSLEEFFRSVNIPTVIQVYPGVKMNNAPETIFEMIDLLRVKPPGLYTTEPRYLDLLHLRKMLGG